MQDMNLSKQHREDLIALCESLKTKSPEDAVSINNIIQFIRDQKFETKKKIMLEVVSAYSPTFMELNGKKPKKKLKKIIEKYDIPKWTFWRMCTNYFQSGFQDYSLVDAKYFANWCQKQRYPYRNGKLSKEKIEKLQILGFIFDKNP